MRFLVELALYAAQSGSHYCRWQANPFQPAHDIDGMTIQQIAQALAERYRVERELGRGGMAVVYLAHDLKHDRQVALKVLRPELAAMVGSARFLSEIRTTARLQHPNIVPLFDSGDIAGQPYYVMPFIAGETLRDMLVARKGPLPVRLALQLTSDVGNALEYAHSHGVVHRDIKPENILISDGRVCVTDFGIALAIGEASEHRLTQTGVGIGTPTYMSPEQASGERTVGPQSDIYSLACVCYELLTGEPPFTGSTVVAIQAKKLFEPPPHVSTLRDVSPSVDNAIASALARDPVDRPGSASAFIESLAFVNSPANQRDDSRRTPSYMPRVSVLLLAGLIIGGAAWLSSSPPAPPALGAVQPLTTEYGLEIEPSMSPDGRSVAYAGGIPSRIYLRQPGSRPILLAPDTGPPQRRPRWSPDGTRIVFDADRSIYVIPALGGVARQVVSDGWSPTWSPDGQQIAFALGDSIFSTGLDGGHPKKLALVPQPAELTWSGDGRWIALTSGNDAWDGITQIGNIAQSRIVLVSAADGRVLEVAEATSMNVSPQWSPDGRQLLFISNRDGARDIFALRINNTGSPIGIPSRLTTGLGAHTFGISPTGDRLTYAAYEARVNVWSLPIPDKGPVGLATAMAHTSGTEAIESISVSRDGRWLYFTSDRSGNSDIWRVPVDGGEPAQLTEHPADDFAPELSPDGKWIAFYSFRGGSRDIWLMPNGPGEPVRLTDNPGDEYAPHWSPDGRSLCYGQRSADRGNSARVLRMEDGQWGSPIVLPGGTGAENNVPGCAGWHTDGRHLIVQNEGEIALLPIDGGRLQTIYTPDATAERPVPLYVRVEPATGTVFFRSEKGIGKVESGSLTPRQLILFDDPSRQPTRVEMAVSSRRVFFSLGDPQSNLFVARLSSPSRRQQIH